MGVDTFICGDCQQAFHDINEFALHKNNGCHTSEQDPQHVHDENSLAHFEGMQLQHGAAEEGAQIQHAAVVEGVQLQHGTVVEGMQLQQGTVVEGVQLQQGTVVEGMQLPHGTAVIDGVQSAEFDASVLEVMKIEQSPNAEHLAENQTEIHLVPISVSNREDGTTVASDLQVVVRQAMMPPTSLSAAPQTASNAPPFASKTPGSGRRRGRPRKGEEKTPKVSAPKVVEKPVPPQLGSDGKFHCVRCKKGFLRERHYTTHRCMATSDYVDITRREALGSDEEPGDSDEDEEDKDKTVEFRAPGTGKRGRPKGSKNKIKPISSDKSAIVSLIKYAPDGSTSTEASGTSTSTPRVEQPMMVKLENMTEVPALQDEPLLKTESGGVIARADSQGLDPQQTAQSQEGVSGSQLGTDATESKKDTDLVEPGQVGGQPELGENVQGPRVIVLAAGEQQPEDGLPPLITHRDQIADIPVFVEEDDKVAFEESLNIDLSQVDDMFNMHVISQDVNDNAPPPASRTSNELSIFSCKVCEKVVKTLSHMRLHCLSHTTLKPFKCTKCNYASNSKGNLYTHMRKHTGQFYRCSRCAFKTVNKSHLVEHEATHANVRHRCALCRKDYHTFKSLTNHVRKYHGNTKAGREYLGQFQGKVNGTKTALNTVLHQCHICNRKFKKQCDRDRHLFVHNIRAPSDMFVCDLCFYTASRRPQFEHHYRKHRVIYFCSECGERFPSTVRLNQHLETGHACTDVDEKWMEVFQACINSSVYLPEPDGSIDLIGQTEDEASQSVAAIDGAQMESAIATLSNPEMMPPDHPDDSQQTDLDSSNMNEELHDTPLIGTKADLEDGAPAPQLSTSGGADPLQMAVDSEGISAENDGVMSADLAPLLAADCNSTNDSVVTGETRTVLKTSTVSEDNSEEVDIIKKLQYNPLTMDIFHRLRQTFGHEECEFCGRLFYSQADYEAHLRTHTGDKPFACQQCGYRSSTKDNLKRHIEKEHDKVKYVCQECDFVANTRTQLWHHQQKHKQPPEVSCSKCNLKFTNLKRLRIHLVIKHPELSTDEVKKMLSTQKPQGKIGRRSYKCPYCDKMFLRASSDLQKHIWIHEGIKPFKCSICQYACRSKNNLTAHLLRHSAEKPFSCGECGKAYKSKTALRWHVRTHKDGKIFKCPSCDYEAIQKSHLKRHMETHNVVKRFVCHHCDYSANTLGYMKIHYTRSHKGLQYSYNPAVTKPMLADARVYRCLSCDYLFGNLSDMKRHLKVRHHLQVEDIHMLEDLDGNQTAQIVATDTRNVPQVIQSVDEAIATPDERTATAALQTLQYSVPSTSTAANIDERTASTVTLLQQILDMSQQGTFTTENGQMVTVNQDTIIVHQEGEEVVVSSGGENVADPDASQQFVIQYVTREQPTDGGESSIQQVAHLAPDGQVITGNHEYITTDGEIIQPGNIILGENGEIIQTGNVVMDENGEHLLMTDEPMQSMNELATTSIDENSGIISTGDVKPEVIEVQEIPGTPDTSVLTSDQLDQHEQISGENAQVITIQLQGQDGNPVRVANGQILMNRQTVMDGQIQGEVLSEHQLVSGMIVDGQTLSEEQNIPDDHVLTEGEATAANEAITDQQIVMDTEPMDIS